MVSVKCAAIAGFATVLASVANAADMPVLMPVQQQWGGWYLRGDIGFSNQRVGSTRYDFGIIAPPDSVQYVSREFETGGIFGLGIGYQFNTWLRFDVTGEYRSASTFHGFEINSSGGNTIPEQVTLIKSEWVALANIYADLGTWWYVTPFIGAGIGVANVRLGGFTDTAFIPGDPPSVAMNYAQEGSQWNFAWALYAGLAYKVTPNFAVEFAYRYLNMGDGKTGSPITGYDASYQGDHYELKNIYSHDLKFGVRWMLEPPMPAPIMSRG
jgi:opacity protein-like surface antigen